MANKSRKIAFALSMILVTLVFVTELLMKLFGVSPLVIRAVVWSSWVILGCFYGIHVWRQSKREAQSIEEKYEAKMQQLIAERQSDKAL